MMNRPSPRVVVSVLVALPLLLCYIPARAAAPAQPRVSIVFAGDVMLDGGPGHTIAHGGDPFAEFADILRKADLAVCNLECVLAPGGDQVLKPYTFRGPEKAVPLLKKYFSAVTLANNHTGDFGPEAFLGQLEMLDKAELPYFGGGRNTQEARRPLILERKGVRVALLGYNRFPPRSFTAAEKKPGVAWLVEEQVLADVRAARTKHRADVVIPFLHWGVEETEAPTREQKALARRLIDAGANAIIGAHPHVTQTMDVYKGRPIVYSLGNFVFDYFPSDPLVWIGWVVRLDCAKSGEVDLETFALDIDKAGTPHPLPESDRPAPEKPPE
jgi:poly-gamma-glutamate capsule biosynthesis protein CapA/YwtB (metallophosphatase superfamily)